MFTKIKIRFNLSQDKIKRIFFDGKRPLGTQQLVAIISFLPPVKISSLQDGSTWVRNQFPGPKSKYSGSITYGWGDIAKNPEEREKMKSTNGRFRGYKVNANGELIKYDRIKINTGLYILKEAWNTQLQIAQPPYDYLNNKLAILRHIIDTTFHELILHVDFSKEKMLLEVKERMLNGMPQNIVIPVNKATSPVKTFELISKELKRHEGINIPDENNPKSVPEDLQDFIDYYLKNRTLFKKLADSTEDRLTQFRDKLIRWKDLTGKKLTITGSDIRDVAEFLKWRMYDNEENNVRKSIKIKSVNQISRVKNHAIGVGTLNKTKKDIKYFYNRAHEEFDCKIRFSTKNSLLKEQKYDREMSDVYLSIPQIMEILNLNLESGSRLEKHRNLFVLGCLGGGYRISDLVKLPKPKYEEFNQGEFFYTFAVKSTKTNAKTWAPIPEELNYVVESYPFGSEVKEHDFRDDIKELGKLCGWLSDYNYVEELADGSTRPEIKPFYDMLQSKTCRKTYCSLLYNFWGLTIQECMNFSGHDSEEEFLKYLRIDQKVQAQKLVDRFKIKPILFS